jgi:hypothetical protein
VIIKWTGLGWLTLILVIASLFTGVWAGYMLTGGGEIPAAVLIGAGVMTLLAPLHWLFGLAVNSKRSPSGRRWHDDHTFFDMPVQYGFAPQLGLALILGSVTLGQLTSPLYGWLLFGGVPALALAGYGLFDKERHIGPVSLWFAGYLAVALVIGAIAVGRTAGTLYGWLVFGGGLLVATLGYLVSGPGGSAGSPAETGFHHRHPAASRS